MIACPEIVVLTTDVGNVGDPGQYFSFSKEAMNSMVGAGNWESGAAFEIEQSGSKSWTGKVQVWDLNHGPHGRRDPNSASAAGQWVVGDTITLKSCLDLGKCIWLCIEIDVFISL